MVGAFEDEKMQSYKLRSEDLARILLQAFWTYCMISSDSSKTTLTVLWGARNEKAN